MDLLLDPAGADLNRGKSLEGSTPRHQFGLRSFLDLPARFQFDAQFRPGAAIGSLPSIVSGEGLPGYSELDLRLAWDGWKQLELSVVGQDLLHNHHAEFGAPPARGEIERGVYGKDRLGLLKAKIFDAAGAGRCSIVPFPPEGRERASGPGMERGAA